MRSGGGTTSNDNHKNHKNINSKNERSIIGTYNQRRGGEKMAEKNVGEEEVSGTRPGRGLKFVEKLRVLEKCEEFFEEKWMVVSQESGEIQMSSVLKKTKTRRLDGSDKSH